MKLLVVAEHQYGPGRTHIAAEHAEGYDVTFCTYMPVYATRIEGTIDDVTCKRCLKRYQKGRM